MTSLFRLKPIGVGTADVESLPSYLHRLAYQHGVSIGKMLEYLDNVEPSYEGQRTKLKNQTLISFLRPKESTAYLIACLNAVTDVGDLHNLSFLFLSGNNLSSQEPYLFAREIRWCPVCFEEFRLAELDGYYKLIWQLEFVYWCPYHRVRLEHKCPHCGCEQGSGERRYPAILCQNCGSPLSRYGSSDELLSESWEDPVADVQEFLCDIPKINSQIKSPDPQSALRNLLRSYSFADETGMFKDPDLLIELIQILFKGRRITFRLLRRVAYEEGLPISAFLLNSTVNGSMCFDFIYEGERPTQEIHKRAKKDHERIYREILSVVETSNEALSIRGLAKEVGVSKGYIEDHFPHLAADLVERRRSALEKRKLSNQKLAECEALRVCQAQLVDGYISKKAAYRELAVKTDLPKNLLREAIKKAAEELQDSVQGG